MSLGFCCVDFFPATSPPSLDLNPPCFGWTHCHPRTERSGAAQDSGHHPRRCPPQRPAAAGDRLPPLHRRRGQRRPAVPQGHSGGGAVLRCGAATATRTEALATPFQVLKAATPGCPPLFSNSNAYFETSDAHFFVWLIPP